MNENNNGWISVSDRLPDKIGHYIVHWDDGEVDANLFFPGSKSQLLKPRWARESDSRCVTHWQPLPVFGEEM